VFAVDSSGKLRRYWFDGTRWNGWQNLGMGPGGVAYSSITAATSPSTEQIEVFGTTTTDQSLVRRWFDTSAWYGPAVTGMSPDGNGLVSAAASSWSDGRLHVVSLDTVTREPVYEQFLGNGWLAPQYID